MLKLRVNNEEEHTVQKVGVIKKNVSMLLGLSIPEDEPIYLGSTNIAHMQSSHPEDFKRYGADIITILLNPDYVGLNKRDNSIEYVKEYKINNDFVKVAVRVSKSNRYYARSLYVLNRNRVINFIKKDTLKPCN